MFVTFAQEVCDGTSHTVATRCLALILADAQQSASTGASCTTILAEHEWEALDMAIHRRATLPATPPTVRQAVRWVAQLGGFLARKGDGEPGITTIWRGWSRFAAMAAVYLITHPSADTGKS